MHVKSASFKKAEIIKGENILAQTGKTHTIELTEEGLVLVNNSSGQRLELTNQYDRSIKSGGGSLIDNIRAASPDLSNLGKYEKEIAGASFSDAALSRLQRDYSIDDRRRMDGFNPQAGIIVTRVIPFGSAYNVVEIHLKETNGDGRWEANLITPEYEQKNSLAIKAAENQSDRYARFAKDLKSQQGVKPEAPKGQGQGASKETPVAGEPDRSNTPRGNGSFIDPKVLNTPIDPQNPPKMEVPEALQDLDEKMGPASNEAGAAVQEQLQGPASQMHAQLDGVVKQGGTPAEMLGDIFTKVLPGFLNFTGNGADSLRSEIKRAEQGVGEQVRGAKAPLQEMAKPLQQMGAQVRDAGRAMTRDAVSQGPADGRQDLGDRMPWLDSKLQNPQSTQAKPVEMSLDDKALHRLVSGTGKNEVSYIVYKQNPEGKFEPVIKPNGEPKQLTIRDDPNRQNTINLTAVQTDGAGNYFKLLIGGKDMGIVVDAKAFGEIRNAAVPDNTAPKVMPTSPVAPVAREPLAAPQGAKVAPERAEMPKPEKAAAKPAGSSAPDNSADRKAITWKEGEPAKGYVEPVKEAQLALAAIDPKYKEMMTYTNKAGEKVFADGLEGGRTAKAMAEYAKDFGLNPKTLQLADLIKHAQVIASAPKADGNVQGVDGSPTDRFYQAAADQEGVLPAQFAQAHDGPQVKEPAPDHSMDAAIKASQQMQFNNMA